MIRAKFQCTEKTETASGFKVTLLPVTTGSKENETFYKWTPSGQIVLSTIPLVNPFVVSKNYYVDFTETN